MHFQVAVACPPSTVLYVRGGNVWKGRWIWGGDVGDGNFIPPESVDFSDPDSIDGYDGNFTNAYYYKGYLLGIDRISDEWFCTGDGDEFATGAEAEADIGSVAMLDTPWTEGLPLIAIVLRNNGNVGMDGAVMAIDRVNRGRSYYWKDMRPRHYIAASVD